MNTVLSQNDAIKTEDISLVQAGEKVKRTLVKTISWRVLGTVATIVISYAITGTLALAFSIGFIELISKLVLYYFHERTWNKIKWGR
ncbi:DUF2061 domain-containing protein [Psychroserpens sp. AS72]|uniref:DUF2061 domain-containing protein n=1 Tax=Psychroserpens sp. AS72 TaxID=3135775 RepID=UPI0031792B86